MITYKIEECHECCTVIVREKREMKKGICPYCGAKLIDSEKEIKTGDPSILKNWRTEREEQLFQKIKDDPDKRKKTLESITKRNREFLKKMKQEQKARQERQAIEEANRLHCPRCGSVNIAKANPMYIEGIRMCWDDYECHTCGYQWR